MDRGTIEGILANPISQQLMTGGGHLARLAYNALDGTPRVIPTAFRWVGFDFEMFTVPGSAKIAALRANPKLAMTIDTSTFPPHALLVRGSASAIDTLDGVPDGYLEASHNGVVADEQMPEFEAGVRALYDSMVRITITPEWVKLLDFETTAPSAVEKLAQKRQEV